MTDRDPLTLALVQDNPVVGAIAENRASMLAHLGDARRAGARLVVFPELATVGYPPKDLLDGDGFVAHSLETLDALAAAAGDLAVLVGHVARNPAPDGKALLNAASLIDGGRVVHTWHKTLLPSYDVFDETRYFEPGTGEPDDPAMLADVTVDRWRLGVTICEDIWTAPGRLGRLPYHLAPARRQIARGVDLLLNVSASPYEAGKLAYRRRLVTDLAREGAVPFAYCNQIGANDELVFDGGSFVVDAAGRLIAQAKQFVEDLLIITLDPAPSATPLAEVTPPAEGLSAVLTSLDLGLADYLRKCGFRDVVLGLSGGVDSALVAAIAARALGPTRVTALLMPSPYSSEGSITDALELARRLGIAHHTVPIGPLMDGYDAALAPLFAGLPSDVTEENIQARVRGNLLMAWSNKKGSLLLSTANKSEAAVGYSTLYGDMAGGLALISDVPKMMVYDLCRLINAEREIIPESILTKPPSAELRPDQKDEDSLPPYAVLDLIIRAYIEDHQGEDAIVAQGPDRATVRRIIDLIHRTEYKRRQAPLGIKITPKAFGSGRRFPIAHRRS